MKKLICLLPALCCVGLLVAQNSNLSGGLYKHVIDVEAYDDWGKGYLTVIDNHCVTIDGIRHLTAFEPVLDEATTPRDPETGELILQDEAIPDFGSVIYEVNGQSTLGMTPEQFYQITDTAIYFSLQYETVDRNIVTYTFERYTELVNIMYNFNIKIWMKEDDEYEAGLRQFMLVTNPHFARKYYRYEDEGNIFNEVSDETFDFHDVRTYDYQITGDDPLTDKKILDEIGKPDMVRDTENPDILFTIQKNREGDIHLELAALDAKQLRNKKKKNSTLPVVWQMTVDRERRKNENIIETYVNYAGWAGLPITDRFVNQQYQLYRTSGIELNEKKIVTKVYDDALCSFLQPGDEITKVEVYDIKEVHQKNTNSGWLSKNTKKVLKNQEIDLDKHLSFLPHWNFLYLDWKWEYRNVQDHIVIYYKRGKKKMQATVQPVAQTASRAYFFNKEKMDKFHSSYNL